MGRRRLIQSTEVVIIGGGPAGVSAAIWCKRLGIDHILLESQSTIGGQLPSIQNQMIDYPGIITKNGKELQELFYQHLKRQQCSFWLDTAVLSIDLVNSRLMVKGKNGESENLRFRYIIFAAGSSPRRLNVPGELEMIERGEIYTASSNAPQFENKPVAVIGGGDRALEGALILADNGAYVRLIHRTNRFRARKEYVEKVRKHPNIQIYSHFIVDHIDGDKQVSSVTISNSDGEKLHIPVEGVFVRIGVKPNSGLLQGIVDMDKDQYIIHNHIYQTSQPNIFAIGDVCTRPPYSSISSAVGQGMVASKTISLFLS